MRGSWFAIIGDFPQNLQMFLKVTGSKKDMFKAVFPAHGGLKLNKNVDLIAFCPD